MIKFINLAEEKPFKLFEKKYNEALAAGQTNIEAMSVASYNNETKEVDSRFVNLKFINRNSLIFFTNYESTKSKAFKTFNQVSCIFYWSTINVQIRIKAKIFKTPQEFNIEYFKNRSKDKNALAISSDQSKHIKSYEEVIKKYNHVKDNNDLDICPDYWGGYSLNPYEIEFWKGSKFRLNKRHLYKKSKSGNWNSFILEP